MHTVVPDCTLNHNSNPTRTVLHSSPGHVILQCFARSLSSSSAPQRMPSSAARTPPPCQHRLPSNETGDSATQTMPCSVRPNCAAQSSRAGHSGRTSASLATPPLTLVVMHVRVQRRRQSGIRPALRSLSGGERPAGPVCTGRREASRPLTPEMPDAEPMHATALASRSDGVTLVAAAAPGCGAVWVWHRL